MLGCGSGKTSHHLAQTGNEGDLEAGGFKRRRVLHERGKSLALETRETHVRSYPTPAIKRYGRGHMSMLYRATWSLSTSL